ncbi:hypothetical protein ABH966_003558 [Lysinibacillus sp. RC46]|uniref:hypothetical protein n=1 Tax=Lysinibacillus sp. RC46 TaxID=3156295 RepID=UPI0035138281
MTIILNSTGNPITREERIKINENWDRIISGLTKMQYQINMLAGGEDVQKILEAIQKALNDIAEAQHKSDEALLKAEEALVITIEAADNADTKAKEAEIATQNANNAAQKALDSVQGVTEVLADLDKIKQATITATQNANEATVSANQASTEAKEAAKHSIEETDKTIKNMNDTISASLNDNNQEVIDLITTANKEIQDAISNMSEQTDTALQNVRDAITESNKISTENTQKVTDAIDNMKSEVSQSVIDANTATVNANKATQEAIQASENIKGWDTARVWNSIDEYIKNNVVTDNGSTWQATKPNTNSKPSTSNENWILLAQRGVDGTGAVSSVNNVFPDEQGNVELDIGEGTIKAINNKLPDSNGSVTLSASDVDTYDTSILDATFDQYNNNIAQLKTELDTKTGYVMKEQIQLDPDKTLLPQFITDHKNVQSGDEYSRRWMVEQKFVNRVGEYSNRIQIATKIDEGKPDIKVRRYAGYAWSSWSPSVQELEQDIQDVKELIPSTTTGDITWHISPTGNDTTGDGTESNPFKTVQSTIDKLPKCINHNVTINLYNGDYKETLNLEGFYGGGGITIEANSFAKNCTTQSIEVINCSVQVTIQRIGLVTTLKITNSRYTTIRGLIITESATSLVGVAIEEGSKVQIDDVEISNRSIAIEASLLSEIYLANSKGTGNSIGLAAYSGSTIIKFNRVPTGDTPEYTEKGGLIR